MVSKKKTHLTAHTMMKLEAFGLQQQKTPSDSTPISQEEGCESLVDTGLLKLDI